MSVRAFFAAPPPPPPPLSRLRGLTDQLVAQLHDKAREHVLPAPLRVKAPERVALERQQRVRVGGAQQVLQCCVRLELGSHALAHYGHAEGSVPERLVERLGFLGVEVVFRTRVPLAVDVEGRFIVPPRGMHILEFCCPHVGLSTKTLESCFNALT
mmetsp:Transcript_11159/g.16462  ORF Transcript_11159/g.16462 Transcript_11159/m.16462 type:complete len:156 (-) Transcript_11159:211-678(-)